MRKQIAMCRAEGHNLRRYLDTATVGCHSFVGSEFCIRRMRWRINLGSSNTFAIIGKHGAASGDTRYYMQV